VDLAVPRDIDPAISREDHVRLLNQDDLGISSPAKQNERVTKIAKQIIDEHIAEFIMWDKVRSILPLIDDIVNTTSEKIKYDLSQDIQALIQDQAQRYLLEEKIQYVIKKTMRRILFRLKDLMVGNR
jgi:glutamyl-tRNA reductase